VDIFYSLYRIYIVNRQAFSVPNIVEWNFTSTFLANITVFFFVKLYSSLRRASKSGPKFICIFIYSLSYFIFYMVPIIITVTI